MDPLSLLKSLVRLEQPVQPDQLQLHPGQMINGKIIRFLPNQMAVIQIGAQKFMAKLEASLLINQPYWFKVQSAEGKVHLKLIKGNMNLVPSNSSLDVPESLLNKNDGLNGVIEQIYTQVPIQIGQDTTELAIQWNGRGKEDGKIDPDNCRILLFIELQNIGEILVDLQIQNRRIRLSVINGTADLNTIAQPFIPFLKENLQRLNYQLSSLKIEPPPGGKSLKTLIRKTAVNNKLADHYQGVDIRI